MRYVILGVLLGLYLMKLSGFCFSPLPVMGDPQVLPDFSPNAFLSAFSATFSRTASLPVVLGMKDRSVARHGASGSRTSDPLRLAEGPLGRLTHRHCPSGIVARPNAGPHASARQV